MKTAGVLVFLIVHLSLLLPPGHARTGMTPWSTEHGYQNLIYGFSSPWDVQQVMGTLPDEIVKSQQMFPVIENHYYFDPEGTGAATLFVFENGMLAGMHLKTPGNQLVDFTYFLVNNGDRFLNSPLAAGYYRYFPYFPMNHRAFGL